MFFYFLKLLLQTSGSGDADIFDIELIFAPLSVDRKFAERLDGTADGQIHFPDNFCTPEKCTFELAILIFERQINMPGAVNIERADFALQPKRHQAVFDQFPDGGVDLADAPDGFIAAVVH